MSGFGQIAVVGLGLLGGSVALGARQRGLAGRIVGATRNPQAREQAGSTRPSQQQPGQR